MYKATHAFDSTADHILSFSKGEGLCVLEKSNESWWLASNAEGRVGYIPINYVVEEKVIFVPNVRIRDITISAQTEVQRKFYSSTNISSDFQACKEVEGLSILGLVLPK